LPAELRSKVKVTPVDPAVVETFLDKGLFGAFLDRHGFAHPRTYVSRELPALSDCENLFVKPRDSQRFFQVFGQKAYWPSSVASLEEKLEEMERIGMEVVLQEYVPGPPSNHIFVDGFVDSNGAVRGCFARRRLRMSPPRFGNSSYMVSISPAEAPAAISLVEDILSASGYRGIFSAEVKEDERDGTFKVLEVNIRPWWFVEFAANCGVNVVSMAYRDALGEPVQGVEEYTVGRRLCHPYYDWFACRLESPGFSSATLKWVRSMAGADRPVFRWSDPGPGVSEALRLGKGFVARRLPWGSNR
jgi:predicted ATP-grasp superfamily ATP-dependent carboligase